MLRRSALWRPCCQAFGSEFCRARVRAANRQCPWSFAQQSQTPHLAVGFQRRFNAGAAEGRESRRGSLASLAVLGASAALGAKLLADEYSHYSANDLSKSGSFFDYCCHLFCHWYSWSPHAPVTVLFGLSASMLAGGGVLYSIFTREAMSTSLWSSWCWMISPDGGAGEAAVAGRVVGALVSVGGLLTFALLLSLVAASFQNLIESQREGDSNVVAAGHTVLVGDSHLIPELLQQLCDQAESRGGNVFVVLSEQSKPEVEKQIMAAGVDERNSTVVVRSARPDHPQDLARASMHTASVLIFMFDHHLSAEVADARMLSKLLMVKNRAWPEDATLLCESSLINSRSILKRLGSKGKSHILETEDCIGDLMVQISRQDGLGGVLSEIFSSSGDELHIHRPQGLEGRTFGDALACLKEVVCVGIFPESGSVEMLPPLNRRLTAGDSLVMLAPDFKNLPTELPEPGNFRLEGPTAGSQGAACRHEEHGDVIMIGWGSRRCLTVLKQLDSVAKKAMQVKIYSPAPVATRAAFIDQYEKESGYKFKKLKVHHVEGPLTSRHALEQLHIERARKIFVLADRTVNSLPAIVDAKTVAVLAHLDDLLRNRLPDRHEWPKVVPELLSRDMADVCESLDFGDYVVSHNFMAQYLATVATEPRLNVVNDEILSLSGSVQFAIRSLSDFGQERLLGQSLKFQDVMALAAAEGSIAVGWSRPGVDGEERWEINPKDKEALRAADGTLQVVVMERAGNVSIE